jgi:hypothetical protein
MARFVRFKKVEAASRSDHDVEVWINTDRIRSIEPGDDEGITWIYFSDDQDRITVRGEPKNVASGL